MKNKEFTIAEWPPKEIQLDMFTHSTEELLFLHLDDFRRNQRRVNNAQFGEIRKIDKKNEERFNLVKAENLELANRLAVLERGLCAGEIGMKTKCA